MLHNLLKVIFVNLNSLIFQIIHSQNSSINNLAAFELRECEKKNLTTTEMRAWFITYKWQLASPIASAVYQRQVRVACAVHACLLIIIIGTFIFIFIVHTLYIIYINLSQIT